MNNLQETFKTNVEESLTKLNNAKTREDLSWLEQVNCYRYYSDAINQETIASDLVPLDILTTEYIREYLGLSTPQIGQCKRMLKQKNLIVDAGAGLLKYKDNNIECKGRYCKIIKKKQREPYKYKQAYCPVRKVFIIPEQSCGVLCCVNYDNGEPYFMARCKGWI